MTIKYCEIYNFIAEDCSIFMSVNCIYVCMKTNMGLIWLKESNSIKLFNVDAVVVVVLLHFKFN